MNYSPIAVNSLSGVIFLSTSKHNALTATGIPLPFITHYTINMHILQQMLTTHWYKQWVTDDKHCWIVNATEFNQLAHICTNVFLFHLQGNSCKSIFVPRQNVKLCQFCFKFLAKHAIIKSVVNLGAATVAIQQWRWCFSYFWGPWIALSAFVLMPH